MLRERHLSCMQAKRRCVNLLPSLSSGVGVISGSRALIKLPRCDWSLTPPTSHGMHRLMHHALPASSAWICLQMCETAEVAEIEF
jgi:hypothetical protein